MKQIEFSFVAAVIFVGMSFMTSCINPADLADLPPLRLGVVSYLNMRPLVEGLEHYAGAGLTLRAGPPSRLVCWLEAGELDMAMVPVAAVVAHPEWRVAPGSMIGARGAVRSVIVTGLGRAESWRVLRPDSHSMTSNALARILLTQRLGRQLEPGRPLALTAPSSQVSLRRGEAQVLIGTRALAARGALRAEGATILDLGSLWHRWTRLPSVFAVWAAAPTAPAAEWIAFLEQVKEANQERLGPIARRWAARGEDGLTPRQAHDYLRRNVDYNFDEDARRGLLRYYEEGCRLGLFSPGWHLCMVEPKERVAAPDPAAVAVP